jgi:hypothetical protein
MNDELGRVWNKLAVEYRHVKNENKEIHEEIWVHGEDRNACFANASVCHLNQITW